MVPLQLRGGPAHLQHHHYQRQRPLRRATDHHRHQRRAAFGPGAANDYIQVSATYTINTITPLFSYLGGYTHDGWYSYPVRVTAIVKNEPALLNFEHTNVYADEPGYYSTP